MSRKGSMNGPKRSGGIESAAPQNVLQNYFRSTCRPGAGHTFGSDTWRVLSIDLLLARREELQARPLD